MNAYENLIRIARTLSESDPLLGLELEESVRTAIIRPNVMAYSKHVERAVATLKSLKSTIEETMKEFGDVDAENMADFASSFDDAAAAEIEALRTLMERVQARSASSREAGPKDWLKGLFKKDKKPEQSKSWEDSEMQPSYRMDDADIEDWIGGKKDWDSSKSISEEAGEKDKFFGGVSDVVKMFDKLVKAPSKGAIDTMLKAINGLLDLGKKIIGAPEPKPAGPPKPGDRPKPQAKPEEIKTPKFDEVVSHYVDMLQENAGDPIKMKKYLKELFSKVKADVEDEKVSFASRRRAAVRLATFVRGNPSYRAAILPVIVRLNTP
jgi:ElaB/YqjD/DUF883 family membrane-anchored ribosome-binding protein